MAIFDFKRLNVGVVSSDIIEQVLSYGPLKSLKLASSSETEFTLKPGNGTTWRYRGEDFDYNSKNDPVKGTIQSMQVLAPNHPEFTFKITELDIDIAGLRSVFRTADTFDDLAFLASIFKGNDTFLGTRKADEFLGLGGKDTMNGSDGVDTLNGGAGADTLHGDKGNDLLTGGGGADKFVFDTNIKVTTAPNIDTISDFDVSKDKIVLDDAYFLELPTGDLGNAKFVVTTDETSVAQATGARIVYNSATGKLFYDAPGNKPMYQFAELTGLPVLTADHFSII